MNTTADKNGLTVISTHINADFDAIASVLAAQKLYPGSIVVLPGSNEKNLRNFFINSMAYLFNMSDIGQIDGSAVSRLVLVDTSQKDRIGKVADLLSNPGLEIHVYDHHPAAEGDVSADFRVYEATGATVSILAKMLQEKAIAVSADEATVMCLGIYEDTGGFTFASTTPKDFAAAAFFLEKGASINTISNIVAREMTPEQVGILNNMITSSRTHKINGVDVTVSSIYTEEYVPDFAFLVHKMQKMKDLNVVFALAQMGSKVYIVGRSKVDEVDAGQIMNPFGGGGHPFAASASVKHMALPQVEQELMAVLRLRVRKNTLAREIMSTPPIAATPDISCREAGDLLTRYNINALLVTEKPDAGGKLLGFITRQVVEKVLYHKLEDAPVREYMNSDLSVAGPDDELAEIQRKIIENSQRMLPVVENGAVIGVITRTDLLNTLVYQREAGNQRQPAPTQVQAHPKTRDIKRMMAERLGPHILDILKSAGDTAAGLGYSAYVVGGFVRDLFLSRSTEDVDIVIEGDGIAFAKTFAVQMKARAHYSKKFGTAVITFADGSKIDVASARLEYYQFPAALPTVEMSSIKLDLFRRDFTINTLAVCLNPDKFGLLVDFFSAQRDIKEKTIRVLHSLSFVEDPTRIFRAVRFEQRFGFTIGKMTEGLIKNAVKMDFFRRLSGHRVFGELCQILEEDDPVPALLRLAEFDLLVSLHPALKIDKKTADALHSVREVVSWYDLLFVDTPYTKWMVYLLVLMRGMDPETTTDVCNRLELAPRHREMADSGRRDAENFLHWIQRSPAVKNSELYRRLSGFKIEQALYVMSVTDSDTVKKHISRYILTLRHMEPQIKGRDLNDIGIAPGPLYSEILKAILFARLDEKIHTREEELEFARRYAKDAGGWWERR
ncbi:MAG: CBS domain-containing protein [Thermodesulfobacteriota bacterium]